MCLKRISGKYSERGRTCCRCDKELKKPLVDNSITTCEHCGQQHFTDVYSRIVALTVVEHPELRRRNVNVADIYAIKARRDLIKKVMGYSPEQQCPVEGRKEHYE